MPYNLTILLYNQLKFCSQFVSHFSTDDLPSDLLALLTNVIYFKDAWTIPFSDLEEPRNSETFFTTDDGNTIETGITWMVRTSFEFAAAEVEFEGLSGFKFVAVSLPYSVSIKVQILTIS